MQTSNHVQDSWSTVQYTFGLHFECFRNWHIVWCLGRRRCPLGVKLFIGEIFNGFYCCFVCFLFIWGLVLFYFSFLVFSPPSKIPQLDMSSKHCEAGSVYSGLSFPSLLKPKSRKYRSTFSEVAVSENIPDWLAFLHIQMFLSPPLLRD